MYQCTYFDSRHSPRGTNTPILKTMSTPQCHSFSDFSEYVLDKLQYLGPHLYLDPVLLCKIVRLGRVYVKDVDIFASPDKVRFVSNNVLLPGEAATGQVLWSMCYVYMLLLLTAGCIQCY